MKNKLRAGAVFAGFCVAGMARGEAVSADSAADAGSLQEIQVTARLRRESAQDVPLAVSVIGASVLDGQRIQTPTQLEQVTPDLNLTQANPRQTILSIRGIGGTTQVSDGLESSVGIYEDGVYLGRPGEFAYNLFDLDHVEVLRGPQGTLYGRNTTGGAINVDTKAPTFDYGAAAQVDYGNYDYRQYQGMVNLPLIDNVLALRLTGFETKRDGFLYDEASDSRENAHNAFGGRMQLLFTPDEDFSYRLIASYNRADGPQGTYQYLGNQPATATGINFSRSAALVAPGYAPPSSPYARITDVGSLQYDGTHQLMVSGQGDWHFGDGYTLTSISSYQGWVFTPTNDADFTALPVATNTNFVDHVSQESQELRVSSPSRGAFDWVAGLYYFRQDVDGLSDTMNQQDAWAFNSTLAGLANGTAARASALSAMLNGLNDITLEDPTSRSYAAYLQADWRLDDRWTLTGGFRDTYDRKTQSLDSYATGNSQLLTCAASGKSCQFGAYTLSQANATKAIQAFTTGATDFAASNNLLSGLATVSYKVDADSLVYATYSHGEQGSGLNVGLLPSQVLAKGATYVVAPEGANNYELGAKTQWLDHRLTVDADAFWETVSNYQTNAVFLVNGSAKQALANAGGLRSQGFEYDAAFQVLPGLQLRSSGAYTEATYSDYGNAPCPPEETARAVAVCSLTGRGVANTPRWVANVAVDYSHPVTDDLQGYIDADYSFRSSQNLLTDDSAGGRINGYAIVDLRTGVRFGGGRYDISFWVQNLFDTDYLTNIQENQGGYFGYTGAPRTFGGTLKAEF
jgi:iron complex outermembrane receptor protein